MVPTLSNKALQRTCRRVLSCLGSSAPIVTPGEFFKRSAAELCVSNGLQFQAHRGTKSGFQRVQFRTLLLRMVSNFRMQATRATLAGFPVLRSRS